MTSIPNVSPTNTDATFSVDGAATSAHDTNEFDHTCKHTGGRPLSSLVVASTRAEYYLD